MERTREENEKCFMAGDVTKESYKSKGPLELKKLARGGVSLRLGPNHGEHHWNSLIVKRFANDPNAFLIASSENDLQLMYPRLTIIL